MVLSGNLHWISEEKKKEVKWVLMNRRRLYNQMRKYEIFTLKMKEINEWFN